MKLKNIELWISVTFLLLITGIFYALNCQVPFFSDDLWWVARRAQSLWEAQRTMWFNENGRIVNHAVLQLFIKGGESCYDIGISLSFLIAALFTSLVTIKKIALCPILFFAIACLYLAPDSTTLFYWAAGGCNYMLPLALLMPWMFFFFSQVERKSQYSWWQVLLIALLGFCAGWTHEIFALPVSFACLCYAWAHYKEMSVQTWILIFSFWFGAALIVLSPGTWHRILTTQGGDVNLLPKLLTSFKVFRYGRLFYVLLVLLGFLALSKRHLLKHFFKEQLFLFMSLLAALGIVLILGVGGRAVWSIEVFSMLLLIRWTEGYCESNSRMSLMVGGVFAGLILLHQTCLIPVFREAWDTYREVEEKCHADKNAVHCVPMEDWHSENLLIDKFVAHPYQMMRQDMWMRLPLKCEVVLQDEYEILEKISITDFIGNSALIIGEDFYWIEDLDFNTDECKYTLHPIDNSYSGGFLFLAWHKILQHVIPTRYPTCLTVSTENITHLNIAGRRFVRFERPVCPIAREIESVIIK